MIRHDEADLMISGGSHSMIHPYGVTGFNLLTALSRNNANPKAASRPFDLTRGGFVLGEGAGMLILEELEHARKRGARIYAELTGYGSTCDAFRLTDSHEEGRGAFACIKGALRRLRGCPRTLSATSQRPRRARARRSTVFTESLAIKLKVFGNAEAYRIPISSSKSMIGHLIAAAGAAELITSIMTIQHGVIVPTINYETPDPECDLDYVPNVAREQKVDHVLSNSFGFGGQNVSLIVSRFPGLKIRLEWYCALGVDQLRRCRGRHRHCAAGDAHPRCPPLHTGGGPHFSGEAALRSAVRAAGCRRGAGDADDAGRPCSFQGCIYLKTPKTRKGVLLFGLEFGSNRWACVPYCEFLREAGYDIFTFETRGQGSSPAQTGYEPLQWVTDFELIDFQTALAYMKSRPDKDPRGIGLFGLSKGGSAGLMTAARDDFVRCCVVDGVFAVTTTMLPYMKQWVLMLHWQPSNGWPGTCRTGICASPPASPCAASSASGIATIRAWRICLPDAGAAPALDDPRWRGQLHQARYGAGLLFEMAARSKGIPGWWTRPKAQPGVHPGQDEYKARVLAFFDRYIAETPPHLGNGKLV